MNSAGCVVLGDIIASARTKDRLELRRRLGMACRAANKLHPRDIRAEFRILKGVDEIAGVLRSVAPVYDVAVAIAERIHPHRIRFATALGGIDIGVSGRDVAGLDGEAFHRASEVMRELKPSRLQLGISTGSALFDDAVTGLASSLLLFRSGWTRRQLEVVRKYRKLGSQTRVARSLGVTQQAASDILRAVSWKQLQEIEARLRHILRQGPEEGD